MFPRGHAHGTLSYMTNTHRTQRRSSSERNYLVRQFLSSGLSVQAFARQHGVGYSTLCGWLRRHRAAISSKIPDSDAPPPSALAIAAKASVAAGPQFVEVGVATHSNNDSRFTVRLPGDIAVDFHTGYEVQDVRNVLQTCSEVTP